MATPTTTIVTCEPKPALQDRPPISQPEAHRLAATFKVLANDSRLRLLHALDCAGDLEGALSHLAGVQAVEVLSAARIVTISHDGRLDPAAVSEQAGRLRVRLAPADTPAARAAAAPGRGWWRTPRLLALAAAELLLLAGLAVDRL